MAETLDSLALYWRVVAARIRAQLQYRASFALDVFGMFLISFLDFAAILIIFQNVPALGGWSMPEVALLYATSSLAFALTDIAVGHLDSFPQLIRDGNFDLLLVRPRGTLFQVITADFQLRRVGKALQAIIVLAYALSALQIDWTFARAATFLLMIPSGALIFASVWIAAICIVFWTVEGREAASAFNYGGQFLTQFPIDIYERWLRALLAYVIPMAFVAYFPAVFILAKPNTLGFPNWFGALSPVVAVVAAAIAGLAWSVAVRQYRSAGG